MTETRHEHDPGGQPPSPAADDPVALVIAAYELWNAGDIAALGEHVFHEEIEYRNSPEWPGQPVYRGSEAVTQFLKEEVADVIGLDPVEIRGVEVVGEEIVIALQAPTRAVQGDMDFGSGAVFHVARLRDGKVARVRVYLDHRQALEAARTGDG